MRLVIKESKAEINPEHLRQTFYYTADIDPVAFLKLTTPKSEVKFYETFLKSIKGEKDLKKIKQMFLDLNPDPLENVAHNVASRAINNLVEKGYYDEALAGKSSLVITLRPFPFVQNHEGRARIFMKMIADAMNGKKTKSVNISLTTYMNSWENLKIENQQGTSLWIFGQMLGGEKGEIQKTTVIQNVQPA